MESMTLDKFISYLINWTNDKGDQFKFNWPVKGGWEGWIQVDLIAYILKLDDKYDILREQPIYKDNLKRVDLLVKNGESPEEAITIEIKAESFENRNSFIKGVEDDVKKIETERNDTFKKSKAIVNAVVFSKENLENVLKIKRPTTQEPIFKNICQFKSEVAITVALKVGDNPWNPA